MIYFNKKVKIDEQSYGFHASNEFDWFQTAIEQDPTDMVVGFGTNSAWDIAWRRKAKSMVIGDWDPNPLMGQEYLMRPLLEIAETPAEFVSMLAGVPIESSLHHAPVSKAFGDR